MIIIIDIFAKTQNMGCTKFFHFDVDLRSHSPLNMIPLMASPGGSNYSYKYDYKNYYKNYKVQILL